MQKGEVPNRGWRHWLEGEKLYLVSWVRAVNECVWKRDLQLGFILLPRSEWFTTPPPPPLQGRKTRKGNKSTGEWREEEIEWPR